MKFYNKFIAVGLGLGLTFTGTYMSYSWFTDSADQTHSISIGQLIEEIKYEYMTNASISSNQKDLKLTIPDNLKPVHWVWPFDNNDADIKVIATGGEMSKINPNPNNNLKPDDIDYGKTSYYTTIKLTVDSNTNKFNINNITESPDGENNYVDVKITSVIANNKPAIIHNYRVVVTKSYNDNSNKWELVAHWRQLQPTVQIDLEDEMLPEELPKDEVEVTLPEELPKDEGEVTPPEEIPESDVTVTLPEELPSDSQSVTIPSEEEN